MTPRGPYAKGAAKREEILAAALEVVAEHGCRRTYISEIAERVELTQAGLIHYFRSREELYEEVLRSREEHDAAAYAGAPRGIEGFFAVIEHNQHVPGLVQLHAEYSAEAGHVDHPSHAFFAERYVSLRAALAGDVRLAQADGEMGTAAEPELVADLMIATADGLQVQWLLDRRIDMVERLRRLWQALCLSSGGRGRPGPSDRLGLKSEVAEIFTAALAG